VPGTNDRYLLAARPDRRRGEPDPIYQWLHHLQMDRRWGEAKRLFYVALTRARCKLMLSAVLPWQSKDDGPSFPSQTPLSWLDEHYGLADGLELGALRQPHEAAAAFSGSSVETIRNSGDGDRQNGKSDSISMAEWEKEWRSESRDFVVLLEPQIPAPVSTFSADIPEITIQPAPFEREIPILKIRHPSAFVRSADGPGPEETHDAAIFITTPTEAGPEATEELQLFEAAGSRLFGTLIHRLLEEYGKTGRLPSEKQACGFLRHQGIEESEAQTMVQSALSEVEACLLDPWLQQFYALPFDQRRTEWPLEALHTPRTLYVGQVDLIAYMEGKWWLIDFKTPGPAEGEDIEFFCQKALERYRPQLLAYREMWARVKGLGKDDEIKAIVYWTPLRRWGVC